MFIEVGKIKINIEFLQPYEKESIPVIFLHGFTGSASDWYFLKDKLPEGFSPIAVDLIGHGKSDSPIDTIHYTSEAINLHLDEVLSYIEANKAILVGYSMGGRAALTYAAARKENISGLFLESSTPGIKSEQEREIRRKQDETLAEKISEYGISNFVSYWENIPLFESQKKLHPSIKESLKSARLLNSPTGLSCSLKGFGTGSMPHLWNKLSHFRFPIKLVTGEYDTKFNDINTEMNQLIPDSDHTVIEEAGHNTHLEKPSDFIILLYNFLQNFNTENNNIL